MLALKVSKNPVVYNGDLALAADVEKFRMDFPMVKTIMIGRGLVRNPELGEQIRRMENKDTGCEVGQPSQLAPDIDIVRLKQFHDELLTAYEELMSGDRNVLFRMKEIWAHLAGLFPDHEKQIKKIRKSVRVEEYKAAVAEIFG